MNRNICRIGIFLLTALCFLTVNCGASSSNEEKILGKWEFLSGVSKGESVEFLKNGKLLRATKSGIYDSKYEFIDSNRLKTDMFYGLWEVKIDNGEMSLKQLDKINKGEIWKFKRIK